MHPYQEFIYDRLLSSIQSWNYNGEVYAFYLYFFYEEDDISSRTNYVVHFNYQTIEQWKKAKVGTRPTPSSSLEAKWNYAFWNHEGGLYIGDVEDEDISIYQSWLQSLSIPDNIDDLEQHEIIWEEFIQMFIPIVGKLHQSGVLIQRFDKALPFIFVTIEHDNRDEEMLKANPPNLLDEYFSSWF